MITVLTKDEMIMAEVNKVWIANGFIMGHIPGIETNSIILLGTYGEDKVKKILEDMLNAIERKEKTYRMP